MKPEITLHRLKDGTPSRIFIQCDYQDKNVVKAAARGTATWRKTEKVWSTPVDPLIARRLLTLLQDAVLGEDLQHYFNRMKEKQERVQSAVSNQEPIDGVSGLWDFQKASVRFLTEARKAILAHEMGTGKTVIAASAINYLDSDRVIVVCPNAVKWSWARHLMRWASIRPVVLEATPRKYAFQLLSIGDTQTAVFSGGPVTREEYLEEQRHTDELHLITNYALLRIHHNEFKKMPLDVLVLDEAHRVKNRKSQRTQAAHQLSYNADYVWSLTGTPIRNEYTDYWSLLHMADPVRFSSYWNFVNLYLESAPNIWGGIDILGLSDQDMFNHMLAQYMFRRTKKEVLPDLPDKVYNEYPVPMEEEQEEEYRRMKREFRTYIEKELSSGETVESILYAEKTIQQIMRLRQLALNPAILGGPDSSGKVKALANLLQDYQHSGEQFLVFTHFKQFIPFILEVLEDMDFSYGQVVGGQTKTTREEAVQSFQQGELQCLVGTIGAMGEGLDLPMAVTAFFTDIDWTPAVNRQAEDRIHRPGISDSPTIIRLYHPDSIDEYIRDVTLHKERMEEETVGQVEVIRSMVMETG